MNFENLFIQAGKYASAQVSTRRVSGEGCEVTFVQLLNDVNKLADRLMSAGLTKGMQVGLQSSNCYEFLLWDLAAIKIGAVIHSVPEELSQQKIISISQKQEIALWAYEKEENFVTISNKVNLVDSISSGPLPVARNATPLEDEDLYSRVYSSGSSGYLKGLNISRGGSEWMVSRFISDFGLCQSDSHLISLPLSNYQQRLSVYGCLWSGAPFKLAGHATIFQDLSGYKPSFIVAPPIIYENIYNLYGRAGNAREKLAAFLGGNIRFMITGMAPIRYDALKAFNDLGFSLLEAYGVNETGIIAWNTTENQRVGSVGRPVQAEHIEFTPESEIIIRRPFPLSKGYFDSPPSDSSSTFLSDGAIATGDIGSLDADGYLTLSGRKKEMIVTGGGAKFHPEEIEKLLTSVTGVNGAIVLMSKNDKRLVAVLVVAGSSDLKFVSGIEDGIRAVNASLPDYKRVQRWVFTETAPSTENGMLTGNLKYDRKGIYRFFEVEIEQHKRYAVEQS